jgi:hypothetical protein
MNDERDVVVFENEDGEQFEMDVVKYFEFENEEYAVLMGMHEDCHDTECDCDECDCDFIVMKIEADGEFENFVPVDEDKIDAIDEYLNTLIEEEGLSE